MFFFFKKCSTFDIDPPWIRKLIRVDDVCWSRYCRSWRKKKIIISILYKNTSWVMSTERKMVIYLKPSPCLLRASPFSLFFYRDISSFFSNFSLSFLPFSFSHRWMTSQTLHIGRLLFCSFERYLSGILISISLTKTL